MRIRGGSATVKPARHGVHVIAYGPKPDTDRGHARCASRMHFHNERGENPAGGIMTTATVPESLSIALLSTSDTDLLSALPAAPATSGPTRRVRPTRS